MNHYDILEVSRSASKEVIKAAYKSLMQRYHPDRNPGDIEVAERAVKVSLAYEVLSDPEQRAEYDRSLELQLPAGDPAGPSVEGGARSAGNRRAAVKKSDSSWYVWVLLLLIIGSAWLILARDKNTIPPELELRQLRLELTDKNLTPTQTQVKQKRVDEILRRHPVLMQKEQQAKTDSDTARVLPAYISDLTVKLKIEDLSFMFSESAAGGAGPADATGGGKSSELAKQYKESGRVLFIPEMTVKIGTHDAETVLKHLESKRELIASRLAEKLGFAQYDELLKVTGEKYLVEMILDSIGETTGTDRHREYPANEFEAPARYGVIEVKLPASYSVN